MSKARNLRNGTAETAVDAGRGVTSPRSGTASRAHVASCARCRENVNLWKSFAVVTERLRERDRQLARGCRCVHRAAGGGGATGRRGGQGQGPRPRTRPRDAPHKDE